MQQTMIPNYNINSIDLNSQAVFIEEHEVHLCQLVRKVMKRSRLQDTLCFN